MSEPVVSVVIPAYNAARFIGGAINTVLAQTFTDYELIVVDDGSTDSTAALVREFGDRVRLLSQPNAGAAAARNHGIRVARGTWVAFLDSDDEWQPHHLQGLLRQAEAQPEAHLIYGGKVTVDERGVPVPVIHPDALRFPSGWIFGELVEFCRIQVSTILVRTATLRELRGFNEDDRFWVTQDWDLLLRLAARYPVAATRDTSVTYRLLATSLSHQVRRTHAGNIAALETAERLLKQGHVAAGNNPDRIDMTVRWRDAYNEAVVHLFTVGEYDAAKRTGTEALRRGHWTAPIMTRTMVSCLPASFVNRLRNLARGVPSSGPRSPDGHR